MTEQTCNAPSLFTLLEPRRATVALAHRHRLFLDSLAHLFDDVDAVRLVGCAAAEGELVECVARLSPDIVVFEPFLPHARGLAILGELRRVSPRTKALVILRNVDPAELLRALRSGASGYLSYDTTGAEIVRAIQVIGRGELWVQRGIMQRLLLEVCSNDEPAVADEEPSRPSEDSGRDLSRRELEVAAHVVAGLCNKRIATTLRIAESTVKAHMVNIFRKLGIESRTQLVRHVGVASHARAFGQLPADHPARAPTTS